MDVTYLYLLFYHSPPVCVGFIALLSCHISVSFRMSDLWRQLLAISPVYFLQVCYGMSGAFPAILTPQLTQDCALFTVSDDQESWIGRPLRQRIQRACLYVFGRTYGQIYLCFSVSGQLRDPLGLPGLRLPPAQTGAPPHPGPNLPALPHCLATHSSSRPLPPRLDHLPSQVSLTDL